MPLVGFEPPIPVFERAKTVHALDRAAGVEAHFFIYLFVCTLFNDAASKLGYVA
jgi:hypothetical protein